jgi:hypothetical protein
MTAEFSDTPSSSSVDPGYRLRERRPLIREEQDGMADTLQEIMIGPVREASGLNDQLRLIPSYQTPICLACGTGPPVFKPSEDWKRKAVHTERMARTGDCSGCRECVEEKRIKNGSYLGLGLESKVGIGGMSVAETGWIMYSRGYLAIRIILYSMSKFAKTGPFMSCLVEVPGGTACLWDGSAPVKVATS